jgi:CHASE2 domain-containing sensor protein/two-component sensor histidine kinase
VLRLNLKRIQFNDLASSVLILIFLALILHSTRLFSRVDNLIYDLGQRLVTTPVPDDVIIVAIDENSLSQIGRWPWSRKIHAELLHQLNQEHPAAVGFDVIFSEPDLASPLADDALASAVAESKKVVLPILLESTRANGQIIETLPLPLLSEHAADLGRVHAVLDEDSIARSVNLYEGLNQPVWQLFSQAVINVAENQPSKNRFNVGNAVSNSGFFTLVREGQRGINFLGPPGHFPSISYVQVLKGEFPKGMFNNKIVLVGATALGMNDLLTTPVSGLGLPMAGVEFHANVMESIRTNHLIQPVSFGVNLLIVMLLAIMPMLWMPKLSALSGLLSTFLFLIIVALVSGVLTKMGLWIKPSAALVPIMLAYPIWSWRKLEAAQKYLDDELVYLRQNLIALPNQKDDSNYQGYDKFDARIKQVRVATDQLRYLQNDRKETLAFISHDLRAPLATALMAIEQNKALSSKLHKPLSQALNLAEDFLQASRAEMIDSAKFNEIDFVGLVHQAIDDAYEMATSKQMHLARQMVEGIIWIEANFGLLHRAILNLILNAVKYGPAGSIVTIQLTLNTANHQAIFSVTDHGPGIPIEEQGKLFKRFSRMKGQDQVSEGAGLGLYFVRTVIEKHQGSVHVTSDLGEPTTFSIYLPIIGFQSHQD